MTRPIVLLAAFACAAPFGMVRAQHFTLEQIMSVPFATSLVAARRANTVAWVVNDRGVRNVWGASAPEWKARQITSYTEDDGQEIDSPALSPDGRLVVYARGGNANPALITGGVEQAVWIAATDGGAAPRKIGNGSSPRLSPSGDSVSFTQDGQIWIAGLAKEAGPATQLTKLRGGASDVRWSPDGKRLAFVSNRERHAFIGVWDLPSRTLRYVDPTTDQDGSPVWSPDGKSLAFMRTPAGVSDLTFVPERESAIPWSIRVADASTGSSREIWRAKKGRGSVFREIVADDQLFWDAGGTRIVFPWEADGWTHLYSVPIAGGSATLLTPGAFEVEHATAHTDGRSMVFSSNQGDIDRRHVWRVPNDATTKPVALTTGTGLEWGPVVAADGKTLALRSDARTGPRVALVEGSALRDLVSPSANVPSAMLVEPKQVVLTAADGTPVHAQLFLPRDAKAGDRRPAAIFFHGGSRRQMLLGWHYMNYYANTYAMNQYLANRGYVVLSVNYRSGIGYGLDFREALAYGASGASEYQDVVAAGRYLRARADVDAKRIALWGGSYGGYLTALGLARNSDLFAAGVDIHGVHDWNSEIRNFMPAYDSLHYTTESKTAYRASPIASVSTWRSPVLLIHGDDDRNVPFNESVLLAHELRKRGVPVEQLVFPDEVHFFLLWRNWMSALRAADDFLARRLVIPPSETAARGGKDSRPPE